MRNKRIVLWDGNDDAIGVDPISICIRVLSWVSVVAPDNRPPPIECHFPLVLVRNRECFLCSHPELPHWEEFQRMDIIKYGVLDVITVIRQLIHVKVPTKVKVFA